MRMSVSLIMEDVTTFVQTFKAHLSALVTLLTYLHQITRPALTILMAVFTF